MLEEIMFIFLVLLVITVWVVGWIRDEKKSYKDFNKIYPVGSFYFTKEKKLEFHHGKWRYRGTRQDGYHVFMRVK